MYYLLVVVVVDHPDYDKHERLIGFYYYTDIRTYKTNFELSTDLWRTQH